ncbi:hypothetical protein L6274_00230 [Candidatus Parcubacteria bacterium]|nr:hypothetical protein [Patescibacteria group bacterium]MCG2699480.1 hypothetical protein [Candidatus Parcubacteria bacterium]
MNTYIVIPVVVAATVFLLVLLLVCRGKRCPHCKSGPEFHRQIKQHVDYNGPHSFYRYSCNICGTEFDVKHRSKGLMT